MRGAPTGFWGKLEQGRGGEVLAWHPLIHHCADVAACCEALLEHTLLRRRLARFAGWDDLSPVHVQRLAVLAAFHDIGKFNHGFQNKALAHPPFTAGHVREVLGLFTHEAFAPRLGDALEVARWEGWAEGEGALALLVAAISHHGRPAPIGAVHQDRWWSPFRGVDSFEGIAALRRAALDDWFPEANEAAPPFPATPGFQHAFSGLVMLADWLGSDTRFFEYSKRIDEDRIAFARKKAVEALVATGIASEEARRRLVATGFSFERSFGFSPRGAQTTLLSLPPVPGGGLTILEAETGAGKTEAALAHFLRLFEAGEVDGLYFALPTRTAATQIHQRVVRAVAQTFSGDAAPPVVLAVPGYLRVDDREGTRLAPFDVLWNDDPAERYRYRGWAAEGPKRYLAASIAVGTIDQVLLGTLMVGHAHLRNTSLLRHLLVVDEVHASDVYMTRLLEEVLRRHLEAGGHALLMSATLGSATAARLQRPGARRKPPRLDEAVATPFPCVARCFPDGTLQVEPVPSPGRPKRVQVECLPAIDRPDEVVRRALDAASRGARVLVLRNLVRDCVRTQIALEEEAQRRGLEPLLFTCRGVPAPHHAHFSREDRIRLDEAIEAAMGKAAAVGKGVVAVATQTVQQSLDLDADLLITDLCPVDILLQRIGRLHRHDRPRPSGFDRAVVVVLTPALRELGRLLSADGTARGGHGLGSVYPDLRILEATWRACERRSEWNIPGDNRELVEEATHPEALEAIVAELGGNWRAHATWIAGIDFAHGGLAGQSLVRWRVGFDNPHVCFPDAELERHLSTRLGEGDRRILFPRAVRGPFETQIRELTLRAHLAKEIAADAEVSAIEEHEGGVRFRFGTGSFVYDRLGLRSAVQKTSNADEEDEE